MQDGPNQSKPSYSRAEVLKFANIAGLSYNAKRLAIARLTADERSKFNDFYQNLHSDYNEATTATVRPVVFKRTPLAAIIDHVEEEEEENDTPSVSCATVTTGTARTLIYSRSTNTMLSVTPMSDLKETDEDKDTHLQSLLKDLDLCSSNDDEEELPRNRASRPKAS